MIFLIFFSFACFFSLPFYCFFLASPYHIHTSVSFIPKVFFFLPLNPSLYLFLIMGFPHILIFRLFLSNIWCLLPSHSSWGTSSCPAPDDTFPLTEMLLSHLALSPHALFTLQHWLSPTTCLGISLPRVWIL